MDKEDRDRTPDGGTERRRTAPEESADQLTSSTRDNQDTIAQPLEEQQQAKQEQKRLKTANAQLPVGRVQEAVIRDVSVSYRYAIENGLPTPETSELRESFFNWSYLDGVTEIEHYWLNRPYAFVSVVYDTEQREYRYMLNEVNLDAFEQYVRQDLKKVLRDILLYRDVDADTRTEAFNEEVVDILTEYGQNLTPATLQKLHYYLKRDFVGYGEIDPLMHDQHIEDISCVGPEVPVFVYHEDYRDLKTNRVFSEDRLTTFVTRMAQRSGKHISVANPLIDGSLPDGSRVQLTLGTDVSSRGSNFTVRKFAAVPYTPVDLINWGTLSVDMATYLWFAIENEVDTLYAGGTASGKTTTMNAASFFIPPNSKVISIEDTREITLPHDNWIQSVTREATGNERTGIGMYELLRSGLRQRPEYLLVGEIRTDPDVALTFFQAISSGHTGFTTFHADSIETTIDRLTNDPLAVPRQMVRALDLVVIQRQSFQGSRRVRRVSKLVELNVSETDPNEFVPRTIYQWDPTEDAFEQVNEPTLYQRIQEIRGWSKQRFEAEFELRRKLLSYLAESNVADYRAVAGVLRTYARDSETIVPELEAGTLDPREYV